MKLHTTPRPKNEFPSKQVGRTTQTTKLAVARYSCRTGNMLVSLTRKPPIFPLFCRSIAPSVGSTLTATTEEAQTLHDGAASMIAKTVAWHASTAVLSCTTDAMAAAATISVAVVSRANVFAGTGSWARGCTIGRGI